MQLSGHSWYKRVILEQLEFLVQDLEQLELKEQLVQLDQEEKRVIQGVLLVHKVQLDPQGPQGDAGTAASITVGSTTTGAVGTNASVSNSGTGQQAVFNFTIPTGADGANGQAATIAVGTVSTGVAGSNVSISNSGTSDATVFDFTIPRGDTGASGSFTWRGTWSSATSYGTNEVVLYNGTSYIAVANNQNVIPSSDSTKWNIMAGWCRRWIY